MIAQNHRDYQIHSVSQVPSHFVQHTQHLQHQPKEIANVKQIFHHKHHKYHLTSNNSSFSRHHQRHHHISSSHLKYRAEPSSSSSLRDRLSSNTLERDRVPQLNSDLIDETFKSTAHHDDAGMMNDAVDIFRHSSSTTSSSILDIASYRQTNLFNQPTDGRLNSFSRSDEASRDDETTLLVTRVFNSTVAKASMLSSPLCPSVCQCKWRNGKKTVLCESSSLTSIPDSIESDTQVLNLNNNDLDEFLNQKSTTFSSLGLTNLQRVYLSR